MDRLFAQYVSEDEAGYIDELYMTTGEIIDLRRRGHTIAGHSISHPSLPQLDEADQEREIGAAKGWLELMLGRAARLVELPLRRPRRAVGARLRAARDRDRLLDATADRLGLARRPLPRAARGHGVPADLAGRRAGRAPRRGRVVEAGRRPEAERERRRGGRRLADRGRRLARAGAVRGRDEQGGAGGRGGGGRLPPLGRRGRRPRRGALDDRLALRDRGGARCVVGAAESPRLESQRLGARPATEPARRLAAELGVSLDDVPGTGIVRE